MGKKTNQTTFANRMWKEKNKFKKLKPSKPLVLEFLVILEISVSTALVKKYY